MGRASGRVAAASVATAAVLWLSAAPGRGQGEDVLSPAYAAVLARYARGERVAALAEIASWPEGRLRDEMTRLAAVRRAARACPSATCGARALWDRVPLRAGLMLHADAAIGDWRAGRSAKLSESAVAEYVAVALDDPNHASFARRVLDATVAVHHLEMRWGTALDWGERALGVAPRSVPVLLAMAAIEETSGAIVTPPLRPDSLVEPHAREMAARLVASREARGHYAKARDLARRALGADPGSAEARLRLGRLAWRLGELDAAKAELEPVAQAGGPPTASFLAQLFLGGVLEDEGRLDDAVAAYEKAVRIRPRDQAAGIALSEARHRRGDLPGAQDALRAGLSAGSRRRDNDPFWDYPFSGSLDALARLDALRREVSP